jgi:uncharacterized protein
MSLKDRITEDMKAALRARDGARLSAIRLLLAAIQQREVDERITLGDAEVVSVIEKMLKQRRDSLQQFEAAGRQDLADKEKFEVTVLQAYMPKALSEAEVEAAVMQAVGASGAKGMQDIGKVMALLKPKLAGRTDMAKVSALVKSKLGATTH